MQCYSPILSNTTVHGRIWLKCGKCEACKQRTGRDWFIRLIKHFDYQKFPSYFITLTYDSEHIPIVEKDEFTIDIGFDKPAIQRLVMQLRNIVKQGVPKWMKVKKLVDYREGGELVGISYFAIAEKGELRNRPHYHIMLFNFPFDQDSTEQIVSQLWVDEYRRSKGIIHVGKCEEKSMCYITDYCVTKDDEKTEWRIMSQHIAKDYVKKFRNFHKEKQDFTVQVHEQKFAMPRYMKEKIFSEGERKAIGNKIVKEYLDNPELNSLQAITERRESLRLRIKHKKEKRLYMKQIKLNKNEKPDF